VRVPWLGAYVALGARGIFGARRNRRGRVSPCLFRGIARFSAAFAGDPFTNVLVGLPVRSLAGNVAVARLAPCTRRCLRL